MKNVRLPPDFDPQFLVGRLLEQVRFGPYTVHFDFDRDLNITLESSYLLRKDDSDPGRLEELPLVSSELMILVGKTIHGAGAKPNGTLTLVFDSGAILEPLDNSPNYESYQISSSDPSIIV